MLLPAFAVLAGGATAMRGLDDLVRSGKVFYVGISDAPAQWIAPRQRRRRSQIA